MLLQLRDPLGTEHRDLLSRIDALRPVTTAFGDTSGAAAHLNDVVEFLHARLIPHLHAELTVLHPAVESVLGAPRATETMKAEDGLIMRLIGELSTAIAKRASTPTPDGLEEIQCQIDGLCAVLRLHFRVEEQVLLPILEQALSLDERRAVFHSMAERERTDCRSVAFIPPSSETTLEVPKGRRSRQSLPSDPGALGR